jgi:hypothetical protein
VKRLLSVQKNLEKKDTHHLEIEILEATAVETVAVEISTEVLETEETVVAETVTVVISTEVIEEEMTQMMETGIVLSVIILTSLEELNVTDVASLEALAAVVEMVAVETSTEVQETEETVAVVISTEAQEIEETVAVEISTEVLEMVDLHLLITTGIALNVTTPIFHSVENVTDVASHVLEAVETEEMEAVETVAVEISIEVPEIEETVVVETSTEAQEIEETEAAEMVVVEISTEVIEEEMTQMMETGIVLSVIIQTSLEEPNVTDVASLEALVAAVETVAVETSTEVLEIEETEAVEMVAVETSTEVPEIEETEAAEMVVVEISIETPEAAAETVVVEREEISLAVMMTELSQERIISANQRVKEQDTPTTMHQNQLFHVNLIEIVMIK